MALSTPLKIVLVVLYFASAFADFEDMSDIKGEDETEYIVELLIIVDKSAYMTWYHKTPGDTANERMYKTIKAIQNHYSAFAHDVNSIFKGAESYGLHLQVKPVEIRVLTNEGILTNADAEGTMNSPKALEDFYAWTKTTKMDLPNFDHVTLITGFDLEKKGNKKFAGRAFFATICKDKSVSLFENNFSHYGVVMMAHELAHSLGAKHDGPKNECDPVNFVMSSVTMNVTKNRWEFSPCSIEAIKSRLHHLTRNGEQCLINYPGGEDNSVALGELYSPDSQCGLLRGADSIFCRGYYTREGGYHRMCQKFFCSMTQFADFRCYPYMGSDGFVCGDRKVCLMGKCVFKADAPSVPDNCPQGDQPGIIKNNYTCAELVLHKPFECYLGSINRRCCGSCKKKEPGCEYGDKGPWCSTGLSVPMGCYRHKGYCCGTCQRIQDHAHPDCFYGDKGKWCKKNLKPHLQCRIPAITKYCCRTCRLYNEGKRR